MKALVTFLFFLPFGLYAQQDKFEISGQVSGLPNGSLIFLTDSNNPTDTLAKDLLTNRSARLTAT